VNWSAGDQEDHTDRGRNGARRGGHQKSIATGYCAAPGRAAGAPQTYDLLRELDVLSQEFQPFAK
jgi:hypothetical protein